MNQSVYVFHLQTKKSFPIRSGFIFGRADESDIQILESCISRKHASIELRIDRFFIKDFGNPNGTLVNQKKIQGESPLLPGDRIQIGEAEFEIRLSEEKVSTPQKKALAREDQETEARLTAVFSDFQRLEDLLALPQEGDAIEKWNVQLALFIKNHQGTLVHDREGKMIVTWKKGGVRNRFMALSLARILVLGARVFWGSYKTIDSLEKDPWEMRILLHQEEKPEEIDLFLEKTKKVPQRILSTTSFLENWEDQPENDPIEGVQGVRSLFEY